MGFRQGSAAHFIFECTAKDKEAFTLTVDLLNVNRVWAKGLDVCRLDAKRLKAHLARDGRSYVHHKRDGCMGWLGLRLTKKIVLLKT
jgi:hypothetical protein